MANFNYEWWTVSVKCLTGTYSYEFKAKNKQNVIRQIKRLEKKTSAQQKFSGIR